MLLDVLPEPLAVRGRRRLPDQHHVQILGCSHLLLRFLHHGGRPNAADEHELVAEFSEPLTESPLAGDQAKTSSSRSRSAPSSLGSLCPCRDRYSDNGSTAVPAPPKRVE